MKNLLTLTLGAWLLVGCTADTRVALSGKSEPQASNNIPQPISGQETHGGDLAVAMLRSAMMNNTSKDPADIARLRELMTMPATSVDKNLEDPLIELKRGVWEVNRPRVMDLDIDQIPLELFRNLTPGTIFPITKMVFPHWRGDLMTPEKFREIAIELFAKLHECVDLPMGVDYLFPSFTEADIRAVPIEFTDSVLIDEALRRPVDIGVTLDDEPKILINRERGKNWTTNNYGNHYLAYHEFAHVFLKKARRSDSDHVFATMFFYQCSSISRRFNIRWQYNERFSEEYNVQ